MDKLNISGRNGQLFAFWHKPEKKTDKIVIMTHSFKGDKDYQPIMGEFAGEMCGRGYHVIRFDCYGSGETGEGFKDFEKATIGSEVEDLQDVIKFARSEGFRDVHLGGLSMGTTVSALAYDNGISSLVMWSPCFNQRDTHNKYRAEMEANGYVVRERKLTGEKIRVGRRMWEEMGAIDLRDRILDIQCPVLIIYGLQDLPERIIKVGEYSPLFNCSIEVHAVDGDHDFMVKEAREEAVRLSVEYIQSCVAGGFLF